VAAPTGDYIPQVLYSLIGARREQV